MALRTGGMQCGVTPVGKLCANTAALAPRPSEVFCELTFVSTLPGIAYLSSNNLACKVLPVKYHGFAKYRSSRSSDLFRSGRRVR